MEEMLPTDTDVDPAILIGEFHFGALETVCKSLVRRFGQSVFADISVSEAHLLPFALKY